MKAKQVHYYLVTVGDQLGTFLGGPIKPSKRKNHVWLTNPDGVPVFEIHKSHVKPSTKEEFAKRIMDDVKYSRLDKAAPNN